MTTSAPTSLADAVKAAIQYNLSNIHTAMPAQIVSYDFTTQKASVQPTVNKQWTDGSTSKMPIINEVPVIFPSAGGASVSFPVLAGDTCLLVVCERSITEWLLAGGLANPADPRKLDLTDAVCIPGLIPFNGTFPNRDNNTDFIIEYAGSSIIITQLGAIKINTATTLALGTPAVELIDQLITVFTSEQLAFAALGIDPGLQSATKTACLNAGTACGTAIAALTTIKGTLP